MADVIELTIALPLSLGRAIDDRVASGEYVDAGDYVRDLIRQRLADDEAISAALEHGELSGRSPRSVRDIVVAPINNGRIGWAEAADIIRTGLPNEEELDWLT